MIPNRFDDAQPLGWAFSLWSLVCIALGGLCIIEASPAALFLMAGLLPLCPTSLSLKKRAFLLVIGLVSWFLGSSSPIVALPLVFLIVGIGNVVLLATCLLLVVLLHPYIQNIRNWDFFRIHPASLSYVLIPSILCCTTLSHQLTKLGALKLLSSAGLVVFFLALASTNFLDAWMLTSDAIRVVVSVSPLFLALALGTRVVQTANKPRFPVYLFAGGITLALLIPQSPIKSIVFDESHGKWETVDASYGPDDFGRSVNYTYSKLYQKSRATLGSASMFDSEDDELPLHDTVFMLKMPTEGLSGPFMDKLASWVIDGGRLLVVADHTDLYNTSSNLNKFLYPNFGVSLAPDAVYDKVGHPNITRSFLGDLLTGRILSDVQEFKWQTGTSLSKVPFGTVELMRYGIGFSEEGDYSRPNRFGFFNSAITNRYLNHSAIVALPVGSGEVLLVLDSTPWSNFSIFDANYIKLFKSVIGVLEKPLTIKAIGYLSLLLFAVLALQLLYKHQLIDQIASLLIGLTIGSLVSIGLSGRTTLAADLDYKVNAYIGSSAKTEILKRLVPVGTNNYSRALSALGKYNLDVALDRTRVPQLASTTSKRLLLIEPDHEQLPNSADLFSYLRRGGDIAILFSSKQASDQVIKDWLESIGIQLATEIANSITSVNTSETGSLVGGKALALLRDIRVTTKAQASSQLKFYESSSMLQSYTARPTQTPRSSGILSLSFMAEQFSDDGMGEIWEGTQYSSIGRLREQQLAYLINPEERPSFFPDDAHLSPGTRQFLDFPSILISENGRTKLSTSLTKSSYSDHTLGSFAVLRDEALTFASNRCPTTGEYTECKNRLIDSLGSEWIVGKKSDRSGNLTAVELIGDKRMSSSNSSWNIVFGR